MSAREKTVTIGLLWIGMGATMIWSVSTWWLRALLALIAISVTMHVARLKAHRAVPSREVTVDS